VFDSQCYQISWEVLGLEQGPLNLVSTIEELLERNSSGSDLESREYGRRDPPRWPRGTLYPQMLALTSPKSGGRSVGVVRLRTQATEFFLSGHMKSVISFQSDVDTCGSLDFCVKCCVETDRTHTYIFCMFPVTDIVAYELTIPARLIIAVEPSEEER
jgi:hypothetical protein